MDERISSGSNGVSAAGPAASDSLGRRSSRAESVNNLVPIEAGYFYAGMHIDFSIYIKNGESINLFCSQITLTDDLIDKMDAVEDSGCYICVSKPSYKKVIMNAALLAEENGTEINWNEVHVAADNPKSFEDFIEEQEVRFETTTDAPMQAATVTEGYDPNYEPPSVVGAQEKTVQQKPAGGSLAGQDAGEGAGPAGVYMVNEYGEKISQATMKELQVTAEKVEQYFTISENIQVLLTHAAKNYTVNLPLLESLADQIVTLCRTTSIADIIQCLNSVRFKNSTLLSHTQNVASMNVIIGQWMNMSHSQRIALAKIGLLHDMGKQQIADKILYKPDKLTAEEYEAIKKHPIHSYNIAAASGITDKSILLGIRYHHERMNGMGYPDRLPGKDIPLFARITAISDCFDAMVTSKPYKEDISLLDAMGQFSESRNSELDTKIVTLMLDQLSEAFVNMQVVLSNGRVGRIVSLNSSDYARPIVLVGNEYIKTDRYLKVVTINHFVQIG